MKSTHHGTMRSFTRSVNWAEGTLAASTNAYTDWMGARTPSRSLRRQSLAALTSKCDSLIYRLVYICFIFFKKLSNSFMCISVKMK